MLPDLIEKLEIFNLKMASRVVDIMLVRHARDVGVNVRRRSGKVKVAVIH